MSTPDRAPGSAAPLGGVSPPPLVRGVAYMLIGNGVLSLCRFGAYVFLAKFADANVLGVFDFASIALSAPVVLFFGLETRAAFVADARGQYPFGAYRMVRRLGLLAAALFFAVVVPLLAFNVPEVSRSLFHPSLLWLMFGVCAGRLVFQLAEVDWGVYQRREQLRNLGVSNALRGAAVIASFAVLLPAGRWLFPDAGPAESGAKSATIATWCYVVVWLAIWWFLDRAAVRSAAGVDLRWSWRQVAAVARHAFPLGLVILILTLCDSVPRWIIKKHTLEMAQVGFFGALKVMAMGASFLIVQVANAAANRLAIRYQTAPRAFLRLAVKLGGVAAALGAGLFVLTWLLGRPLLRYAYSPEYEQYYPELLILMAGQGVLLIGAMFGFITTQMRRFWVQVPIQLIILAATTVAAVAWIPDDPLRGAAWTAVVRSVTQATLYISCVALGVRKRFSADGESAG
ncbi:MAG: hypothetical protein D6744_10150 [Planctomycetota bacterium]|nr:MAG: hypothetical protein D6744_10150 [Planctomycetota bacterium]